MKTVNNKYLSHVLLYFGATATVFVLLVFFPRQFLWELLALHFLVSAIPSIAILFLAILILSGSPSWLKFKRLSQSLGKWLPYITVLWFLLILMRKNIYPLASFSESRFREEYMDPVFVLIRIAGALFFMILAGGKLLRAIPGYSNFEGETGSQKLLGWSVVYILSFVVFVHVVSWDWILPFFGQYISVSISWYIFSCMFHIGIAFMAFTLCMRKTYLLAGDYDNRIATILGKYLLAFTLICAYFVFTQYLLSWYGNLPHEVSHFTNRSDHFVLLSNISVILCIALPLLLLFTEGQKNNLLNIFVASLSVLSGHWLNCYLLILPRFDTAGILFSLVIFIVFLACVMLLFYRIHRFAAIEKTLLYRIASRILLIALLPLLPSCRNDASDPGRTYSRDMIRSGAYESYDRNTFLKNGTVMLEAVEGTVNRDFSPDHFGKAEEDRQQSASLLANPIPLNSEIISDGRQLFQTFCINCHGEKGDGRGNLVAERIYLYSPARLNTDAVKSLPDGSIYNVITNGFGIMGAHGGILLPMDRWRVIHYIKHGL